MKSKIYLSALTLLALLMMLSSCNRGGTAAAGGGIGDKISLELALKPGMTYRQVTRTDQKMEQSMMGMKTKIASVTEIYFKNEVLTVDPDGLAEVKCTYERVVMNSDNGIAGKTSFDSNNADAQDVPLQSKSYMTLIGRSINYKINKRGTITEVSGVDSLFDAILRESGLDSNGPENMAMQKALKASFGDEGMKSMMQSASIQLPDVLVAEGDTWGKQISSMGAMPLQMDIVYKIDHIDAEKVILSFEGTVNTDMAKGLDLGIVSMQMDLKGKYSGTSEINRNTGMVIKTSVNQDMTGSMKTMGISMPVTIDQTVTVNPY